MSHAPRSVPRAPFRSQGGHQITAATHLQSPRSALESLTPAKRACERPLRARGKVRLRLISYRRFRLWLSEPVHKPAAPFTPQDEMSTSTTRTTAAVLEGFDDSGAVLVLPDRSRTEDADIVFIQRACATAIEDGLANELVGHGRSICRFKCRPYRRFQARRTARE